MFKLDLKLEKSEESTGKSKRTAKTYTSLKMFLASSQPQTHEAGSTPRQKLLHFMPSNPPPSFEKIDRRSTEIWGDICAFYILM